MRPPAGASCGADHRMGALRPGAEISPG